jgi:hypothetical protein
VTVELVKQNFPNRGTAVSAAAHRRTRLHHKLCRYKFLAWFVHRFSWQLFQSNDVHQRNMLESIRDAVVTADT